MPTPEVPQSQSFTFKLYPSRPAVSASVQVYDDGGGLLASGAATLDAVDTTVAAATDRQDLEVATAVGILPGRKYWIVSAQNGELSDLVRVNSVSGAVLDLGKAGHRMPQVDDLFLGARLTFQLPGSATGRRGTNHEVRWTLTDLAGDVYYTQTLFHIVARALDYQVTAAQVRNYVSVRSGSLALSIDEDEDRWEDAAERATDMVYRRIRASGRYPHLAAEPGAFAEAGRIAMRIALVDDGVRDDLTDLTSYMAAMRASFEAAIGEALASTWEDRDGSLTVTPDDKTTLKGITLTR